MTMLRMVEPRDLGAAGWQDAANFRG